MARHSSGLTKITRPRVGYAHPRERLFDRIHSGRCPLVWVSAPTGAGKTTLAASYTAAFNLRTLWYEVDAGDADPASFFHHLGLAAKAAAPRAALQLPHLTPEYALGVATYSRRFFEELYFGLKAPALLVFDAFQELPAGAPIHQWLADALAVLPAGIRAIVLSRDDHPAEFARLRANAAMDCLGWDDLRLTADEALGIVRNLYDGEADTLPRQTVDEIVRRSDGWAAGLVLMLEANRTRLRAQPDGDRSRELLFDYFASQLFDGAGAEVQQLLLTSALLPTMSAPALTALTGDARAEKRLRDLFRRNYFVTRVGDAPPAYEYHALFREFLLQRAEETWRPSTLAALRRRAAEALRRQGQNAAAVDLLLSSEAWSEAAAEILRLAPELAVQGRFQVLHAWLKTLPESVVAPQPWLNYWQAICLMGPDPARAAECFESAYQAFESDHNADGLYLTFADGIQLAWIAGFDFPAMDIWLDRCEQIRADHPELPSPGMEARVLASLLMGLYFRRLGHERIPEWLHRARALLDQDLPALLRAALLSSLGWHYYGRGDFRSWLQRLNGLVEAGDPAAPPLSQLHLLASAGLGRLHGGEFSAALDAAERGLRVAEESGVHVLDIMLLGVRIEAALFLRDLPIADADLNKINVILASRPNRFYRSFHCYLSCWRALMDSDLSRAVDLGREAVALAEMSGCPYPVATCRHALAHALLEAGQVEEGERWLEQSSLRWEGGEHQHQAFQCSLTEAWLRLLQGEQKAALGLLRQGLARGEAMGYGAPIMARPAFLYPLLDLALREGIHVEFAKRIIRQARLVPPNPADVPPEWPIPVRIHTLGPFEILIDGAPLDTAAPQKNRPLELLKALIAFGGVNVAQDHLAEALWPEAAGDHAIISLHTTLHRLRKLLPRENAVILRDGRVSLNAAVVWVDIRAVNALLERLEDSLAAVEQRCDRSDTDAVAVDERNARQLAELQRRIQTLCRGQFLELEPGRPWAWRPAEELRQKLVRALVALAEYSQRIDAHERAVEAYQSALRFDPLAENLHRRLMRLHASHGDLTEALLVYKRCKKALSLHLNVPPDPATQDLYRSIRERLFQH